MTATTALTAQNTKGVYGIHETPSDFVKKQIDACIEDIGVDVVKTGEIYRASGFELSMLMSYLTLGMLASEATIRVVADALKRHNVAMSVVDPVTLTHPYSPLSISDRSGHGFDKWSPTSSRKCCQNPH